MKKYSKAAKFALIIGFILLTCGDEFMMANNDQLKMFDKILEKILYETLTDPMFLSFSYKDQFKILKEIFNILNRHFLQIQIKQNQKQMSPIKE